MPRLFLKEFSGEYLENFTNLAKTILSNFLSEYILDQPILILENALLNRGPFILGSIFWVKLRGINSNDGSSGNGGIRGSGSSSGGAVVAAAVHVAVADAAVII